RTSGLFSKPSAAASVKSASQANRLSTSARRAASPAQAASRNAARCSGGNATAWSNRSCTRSPGGSLITPPCPFRRSQLADKPGAREAPLARQGAGRHAQHGGRFVHAQAGKVAQHGNLGQVQFFRLEFLDRLVHREEVVGRRLNNGQALGQLDAPGVAA